MKYTNWIGFLISCYYAFTPFLVELSLETRPYPFMMFCLTGAMTSLLLLNKTSRALYLILFFICSLLAISFAYGSLLSIGVMTLALYFMAYTKANFSFQNKVIILIGSSLLILTTAFHFYQMHDRKSNLTPSHIGKSQSVLEAGFNLNYTPMINSFDDLTKQVPGIFKKFFIAPNTKYEKEITFFLMSLYVAGLIYLLIKRSWLLLFLALSSMIIGILFSYYFLLVVQDTPHTLFYICSSHMSLLSAFLLIMKRRNYLLNYYY